MDIDSLLWWFSKVSFVVSFVILVWCGLTVAIKSRQDKEWTKKYVPTLGKEINVTTIRSWLTLAELERRDPDRAARPTPNTQDGPRVR